MGRNLCYLILSEQQYKYLTSEEAKKKYDEWEKSVDDDDSDYGWGCKPSKYDNPHSYIDEHGGLHGKLIDEMGDDSHLFNSHIRRNPGELYHELLTYEEVKNLAKKYVDESKFVEAGILYLILSEMDESCVVIIEDK